MAWVDELGESSVREETKNLFYSRQVGNLYTVSVAHRVNVERGWVGRGFTKLAG